MPHLEYSNSLWFNVLESAGSGRDPWALYETTQSARESIKYERFIRTICEEKSTSLARRTVPCVLLGWDKEDCSSALKPTDPPERRLKRIFM